LGNNAFLCEVTIKTGVLNKKTTISQMEITATNKRLLTVEGQDECKRPALGPTPAPENPPALNLVVEGQDECKGPALAPAPENPPALNLVVGKDPALAPAPENPPALDLVVADGKKMEEDAVIETREEVYNPYEGHGIYAKLETMYPRYKEGGGERIGEGCCFVRVGLKDGAAPLTVSKKTYCVLADRSGSMTNGRRYKNLCDTLQAMFSSIRETGDEDNVDVVVIAFNGSAEVIHGPGKIPDASKMAEIKRKLSPVGGTDIAMALEAFYGVSETCIREGRSVIGVLFTDGEDGAFSQMVHTFKQVGGEDKLLSKLTACSGVSVHYVAICRDADGQLLGDLAKLSKTTFSTVEETEGIVGLIGSFLGLCNEKMPETVTVTITSEDEEVKVHILEKHVNLRFGNDGVSINIPMKFQSNPGNLNVEIRVHKIGALIGETPAAYTLKKTFLWESLKEGDCDDDGFPSMDCVAEEVNRIKKMCDEGVILALRDNKFEDAGVVNDKAMAGVSKLLELTLDEGTIAALMSVIEELEVQGAEIAEAISRGYIIQETRDRATSRALTLDNGMSLSDPTYESHSQAVGRTLSNQLAPRSSNSGQQPESERY